MRVGFRVRKTNKFGTYAARLPREAERLTLRMARYGQERARMYVPVDTGALRESIYVVHNGLDERDDAFGRAMGRLERAKRQYIAYHKRGGPRMGISRAQGRARRPHTLPEQMFPRKTGSGSGHRYGFGFPSRDRGPYRARVIAGMWYAPHVEYPTRGKAGRFYMRRAANDLETVAAGMVTDMLQRVFR